MKKHIVQRGSVQCRREFCVEGNIDKLSDEELCRIGDDACVEWAIDEGTPLHVEQSDIRDADLNQEYECPEILYGGKVQAEAIEIRGVQVEHETTDASTAAKDSDHK